jgi:hypothetical protein
MSLLNPTPNQQPPVEQPGFVASVSEHVITAAKVLKQLHLPDLAIRLRTFLDTSSPAKRLAILTSLPGLYSTTPICLAVAEYASSAPDFVSLVQLILGDTPPPSDVLAGTVPQLNAKCDVKNENVTLDLTKSLASQTRQNPIGDFLEENVQWVQPAIAIVGLVAAASGMNTIINTDWTQEVVNDLFAMSKTVISLRTNWSAITSVVDPLLKVVYAFFGKDYIQPKHKSLLELSKRVHDLHQRAIDAHNRAKVDFFGFRLEDAASLEKEYDDLTQVLTKLQAEEKSLFNFATRMSDALVNIQEINKMVIDKIKAQGGKQRPAVVWVAGKPGTGKTNFAGRLADRLAVAMNTDIYSRTVTDEFWSGYQHQGITLMDDMMQAKEGKDVVEFHAYTSEDAKDVIGAGLTDKGRPFTSRVVVVSSNLMWFADPCPIRDKQALCRRRDICIYAYNPDVLDYRNSHNGSFPDGKWFEEHKTRWFLYNPTYGFGFENNAAEQGDRKFYPKAPYVIREVTEDEIFEGVINLERKRAEAFRQRLMKKSMKLKYPLPSEPIEYDEQKILDFVGAAVHDMPTDASENSSIHEDVVRMEMEVKISIPTKYRDGNKPNPLDFQKMLVANHGWDKDADFWFALDGNLIAHSSRTYNDMELEAYVLRKHIHALREPVFNYDRKEKFWELFVVPDGTVQQKNPLTTYLEDHQHPALLIMGPPKSGKTFALKRDFGDQLYRVDYTDGEIYPSDQILFFDDVCVSRERLAAFQNAIVIFHDNNPKKWKYVVGTMNDQSTVWRELPSDDRGMIERRCHIVRTAYTMAVSCKLMLGYKLDNLITHENFRDTVTGNLDLRPGREEGLYTLTDAHEAIPQIITIEMRDCMVERTRVYRCAVNMPRPKAPEIKVIIPHDTKPDVAGTKILIRQQDGTYKPMNLLEQTKQLLAFARVASQLAGIEIADRVTAVNTINRRRLKNDTGFSEWLLVAPSYELFVTTCDGEVVVFPVDGEKKYSYESYRDGFFFDGQLYLYDENYDVDFSAILARIHEVKMVPPRGFIPPTYHQFAPSSAPCSMVRTAAAFLDVLLELATCFTLISSESTPTVDDTEPERRKRTPASKSDISDSSKNDKQRSPPLRYERRARLQRRPCSSPAIDSSGDKQRSAPTKYESEEHDVYLVRIGKPGDCSYGVIYLGQLYEFVEVRPCEWTFFAFAIPDNFEELGKTTVVSRTFLNETIGRSITTHQHPKLDVASAIATWVFDGNPRNLDDNTPAPELLSYIDWGTPRSVQSRRQAAIASTSNEGTQDKAAFDLARDLFKRQGDLVCGDEPQLHALMLGGNRGLTCAHATSTTLRFAGRDWPIRILSSHKVSDLMLFEVTDKTFPAQPDIRKHIVDAEDFMKYIGETKGLAPAFLPLRYSDTNYLQQVNGQVLAKAVSSVNDGGTIKFRMKVDMFGYSGVTVGGDCGTPIVLIAPRMNKKICGIHFRGANDISLATIVTKEILADLETQKESVDGTVIQSVPCRDLNYHEIPYQCKKTGLNIVATPSHNIYQSPDTSKFRTPLAIESQFQPGILWPFDERNPERRDLLEEGMARHAVPFPHGDIGPEAKSAALQIGRWLAAKISARGKHTRMLTMTEAINGPSVDEFETAKPIDRHGSAGFPLVQKNPTRTTKQDYLFQRPNGLWYFRDDLVSQSVLARANAIYAQASQGVHIEIPWTAYLKDEPVKLKKIYDSEKMKTRVFFSGDFAYQLAYRRAFYAAICRIQELHLECPVRVGIRQLSLEWVTMTYKHLAVSSFGFASDMENWDGSVPMPFLQAMPIIFNEIARQTDKDWKPEHDTIRSAIHKNVEGALIIIRNKVARLTHSLASGFPGTAVENSLINWMLFFCCWMRLAKQHAPELANFTSFMKLVCLGVFGDDNIATVADVAGKWFNFNTFKTTAAEFGFKVTDAAKTGKEVPDLQPLEELEFLKRSFRKSGPYWLPALDQASINKQLTWVAGNGRYTYRGTWPITDNVAVFEDSLRDLWPELAMHGKEYYEDMVRTILRASFGSNCDISPPTYEAAMALTEFGVH